MGQSHIPGAGQVKPNFHTCHATLPENPQNTARFASLGKIVVLNLGIP
jgi:hypothetical protein